MNGWDIGLLQYDKSNHWPASEVAIWKESHAFGKIKIVLFKSLIYFKSNLTVTPAGEAGVERMSEAEFLTRHCT